MKMTETEILSEMEVCKQEFNRLEQELNLESDVRKPIDIIREMVEVVTRMSELDTLYKKCLLKKCRSETRKTIWSLIKTAFTERKRG